MRTRALVGLLLVLAVVTAGCTVIVGAPGPRVVVAPPRLVFVPGTVIKYAPDLPEDVFYYGGAYYKVSGGVWYRTPAWGNPWVRATAVPDAFMRIPPGHAKHHVVRHHPKRVQPAFRPRPAPAAPVAPIIKAPRVSLIAGTSIYHASSQGNVFRYNGVWYKASGTRWYTCGKWGGPWTVTTKVPSAFLKIPRGHRAHGVVKSHPRYRRPDVGPVASPPSRPRRPDRPETPGRSTTPGRSVTPGRPSAPRAPALAAIAGTSIRHGTVSGAHVFSYGGRYFKVVGSTWYTCGRWGASWTATTSVPDAFLKIPRGHRAYGVVKVHPKKKDKEKEQPKRWGPGGRRR